MLIRIQQLKLMRIRIRNPACYTYLIFAGHNKVKFYTVPYAVTRSNYYKNPKERAEKNHKNSTWKPVNIRARLHGILLQLKNKNRIKSDVLQHSGNIFLDKPKFIQAGW
jgi:hypothetical protein